MSAKTLLNYDASHTAKIGCIVFSFIGENAIPQQRSIIQLNIHTSAPEEITKNLFHFLLSQFGGLFKITTSL